MESLVRRSVRTTVAVAGLAALGVGLAAPAFAVPGVPDVSGIGSSPTTDQPPGASTGFTKATDAMSTLPGLFQFAPPSAVQSAPTANAASALCTVASCSLRRTLLCAGLGPMKVQTAVWAPTESTESTEQAPAATPGVLPSIPGSPVAAQASPQVSGLPTDSALQALDAASLF